MHWHLQVLQCLESQTQPLDFWCTKYSADGQDSLPISFADCPGCTWQRAEEPALTWTASSSPAPAVTAAAAAAQPAEPAAVLRELGAVLATAEGKAAVHCCCSAQALVPTLQSHCRLTTRMAAHSCCGPAGGHLSLSRGSAQLRHARGTSAGEAWLCAAGAHCSRPHRRLLAGAASCQALLPAGLPAECTLGSCPGLRASTRTSSLAPCTPHMPPWS